MNVPSPVDKEGLSHQLESAQAHHRAGRLNTALTAYRAILETSPECDSAWHALAMLAWQANLHDHAQRFFDRAVELNPHAFDYHLNMCAFRLANHRAGAAIDSANRALAIEPDSAIARFNLALAYKEAGATEQAASACRHVLLLLPDFAPALNTLGNLLHGTNDDQAENCYRQAVAADPTLAQAHLNLGNLLRAQGRISEAIVALQRGSAALDDPAEIFTQMGNALREQRRFDQAIDAYRSAIAARDDHAPAHNNLGTALMDIGLLDDAIGAYNSAIALSPGLAPARSNRIYIMHFHPRYDADSISMQQREYDRAISQTIVPIKNHQNDRSPDRRLRVGFVSPDFRDHCQSLFTIPLLSNLSEPSIEIVCYTGVKKPDAITQQVQSLCHEWYTIAALTDEQLAMQIQHDRIDVLVDLSGHMSGNRLPVFARKPAPVQVSWLGYPADTGLAAIDYRLSDPWLDPMAESSAGDDRIIRLPETFWCYDAQTPDLFPNSLPAESGEPLTFGCLNQFCKINTDVLRLWARAMQSVAGSRLVLLAPDGSCRTRLLDQMDEYGIHAGRIIFVERLPRAQYLRQYHRIDIALDTQPYNGHTTSLDSFWMGVPVVTLVGAMAVGRAGYSQLCNLGLPELAAHSDADFVAIVVRLAGDLQRLGRLRQTLRARMERSPLMDAPRFARHMESALRRMWKAWCAWKQ